MSQIDLHEDDEVCCGMIISQLSNNGNHQYTHWTHCPYCGGSIRQIVNQAVNMGMIQ